MATTTDNSTLLKERALALAAPVEPLQYAHQEVQRLLRDIVVDVSGLDPATVYLKILGSSNKGYGVFHDRFGISCDLDLDWIFETKRGPLRGGTGGDEYVEDVGDIARVVEQYLANHQQGFLGTTYEPKEVTRSFVLKVSTPGGRCIEVEVFPKKYQGSGSDYTVSAIGSPVGGTVHRFAKNQSVSTLQNDTINHTVATLTDRQCAVILVKWFVKAAANSRGYGCLKRIPSWFIANLMDLTEETKHPGDVLIRDGELVGMVQALWAELLRRIRHRETCSSRDKSDDVWLGHWTNEELNRLYHVDIIERVLGPY